METSTLKRVVTLGGVVTAVLIVGCSGVPDDQDDEDVGQDESSLRASCEPIVDDCPSCEPTLLHAEPGQVALPAADFLPIQTEKLGLDRSHVYFTVCDFDYEACSLKRISKSGGVATTLATMGVTFGLNFDMGRHEIYAAADCNHEVLSTDAPPRACPLVRVSKGGGALEPVGTTALQVPGEIFRDGRYIYFYAGDAGFRGGDASVGIQRVRTDGTSQEVIAADPDLFHAPLGGVRMAPDGAYLYYTVRGDTHVTLKRVPKNGGTPVVVALAPYSLVTQNLVFAGRDDIFFTAGSSTDDQPFIEDIWKVSKSGGAPALVAHSASDVSFVGMTMDRDGNLIWGEQAFDTDLDPELGSATFKIKKWFHDTGKTVLLGTLRRHTGLTPSSDRIKVDDRSVYFTTGVARVYKLDTCRPRRHRRHD